MLKLLAMERGDSKDLKIREMQIKIVLECMILGINKINKVLHFHKNLEVKTKLEGEMLPKE